MSLSLWRITAPTAVIGCLFVKSEMSTSNGDRPDDFGAGAEQEKRLRLDARCAHNYFARYGQKRTADPSHTFHDHLRNIDGAGFYFLDLGSQYLTHFAPGDVHPLHPDISDVEHKIRVESDNKRCA